jgi:hypothetical protein
VSFALGDVVPHIIIRSLHLRVREFEGRFAKRLLQQNLGKSGHRTFTGSGLFFTDCVEKVHFD